MLARLDALGNRTSSTFDVAGRPVATINALGYRTSSVYDAASRRTVLIDPNGHRTTFLFDADSRDAGSIDPLARRVTFGYDAASNRTFKLDPRGNRITYLYDAANRLTGERLSGGGRNTYGYDPVGNRIRLADPTGVYTTSYDARNLPTRVSNADAKLITYVYDAVGLRRAVTDADGGRFTYSHDTKSRLAALVNPQGKHTTWTYDPLDRPTRQLHGNGSLTTQTYDAAGRLAWLLNASGGGAVVNRFTFSYDNAGHRTRVLESSGDRTTWSYDATYQLKRERRSGLTFYHVTYTYDGAGNRLTQTDTGTRTSYTYDAANELLTEKSATTTTYTYDPCGNRIEKNAFAGMTFYNWDEKSRMTRAVPPAGPVTLTYTADGHRVAKTTASQGRKFIYDFEKVLQETDGTNTTTKEYTATEEQYGNLLSAFSGGQSTYYEYDGLGSADALVNDAQTATDRYRYRAFGLSTQYQGTSANDFNFVGQKGYFSDPEISLYFVRARYYDYAVGRWISEDPLGFAARDANLYRYVHNQPTTRTDPRGLYDDDVHFYMTYYIGLSIGLGEEKTTFSRDGIKCASAAFVIAWADGYTDWNSKTQPVTTSVDILRRLHFRTSGDKVIAGSAEAEEVVRAGISKGDAFLTGIGLHAYQDSWSHAGFGPRTLGHFKEKHNPDDPSRDIPKAMTMAKATYDELVKYLKTKYNKGPDQDWSLLEDKIQAIFNAGIADQGLAYGDQVKRRDERWQEQIRKDINPPEGVPVVFSWQKKDDPWAKTLEDTAATVQAPAPP